MRRAWQVWAAFVVSLVVVFSAVAWVSWTAIQLDDARAEVGRNAQLEEKVRLALWRMDSVLTPLIAQENGRPYYLYESCYKPEDVFVCQPASAPPFAKGTGSVLVPSPLVAETPLHVWIHFQFGPGGDLTSPQVPAGAAEIEVFRACGKTDQVKESSRRLAQIAGLVTRESLLAALPRNTIPEVCEPADAASAGSGPHVAQSASSSSEWAARARTYAQVATQNAAAANTILPLADVRQEVLSAVWAGEELLLARRVLRNEAEYVQGCWVDWPDLKKEILAGVADLLPDADLDPVRGGWDPRNSRMLVSLPALLVPGPRSLPAEVAAGLSPVRISLAVAWGCVLAGAIAAGLLLAGVMALSERRAAFVSAVTHELRTPLTTFRMYTEMLAKDMVSDPERRGLYLETLGAEANRLSHLVENVLAYARLERGSTSGRREAVTLGALLDRALPRLRERAAHAGMAFEVDAEDRRGEAVRADPSAVEQILFNLVDNACKYGRCAGECSIRLEAAARENGHVALKVRDHGPGVPRGVRLFSPFSKSAEDAAVTAPGVGLGLALSRRLAREMGGDLKLESGPGEGACFVLELPAA